MFAISITLFFQTNFETFLWQQQQHHIFLVFYNHLIKSNVWSTTKSTTVFFDCQSTRSSHDTLSRLSFSKTKICQWHTVLVLKIIPKFVNYCMIFLRVMKTLKCHWNKVAHSQSLKHWLVASARIRDDSRQPAPHDQLMWPARKLRLIQETPFIQV